MSREPRLPRAVIRYEYCGHWWESDCNTWWETPPAGAVVSHVLGDCTRCRKAKGEDKHGRLPDFDWGDFSWV